MKNKNSVFYSHDILNKEHVGNKAQEEGWYCTDYD